MDMGVYDPSDIRATLLRVELPDAIVDEVAYRNGNEKTPDAHRCGGGGSATPFP